MEKMKFETPDMAQMNVEKIAALFPNCVTESKAKDGKLKKAVNFDALKQMLGESVAEGDESYEFTWVGKRDAMVEAAKPIRKTLRPCVEESKNFDTTENLYIEGDTLEALKLLQEGYLGKVKMIYIDPPYNTGNDFIYKDDFRMDSAKYAEESGAVDDEGNRMVQNSDSNGRFHSDWCSMIYSRLLLARNLLTDDGVIFISIGQDEIHNLTKICDDSFGAENRISIVSRVMKSGGAKGQFFSPNMEYILIYAREIGKTGNFRQPIPEEIINKLYTSYETDGPRKGERYRPFGLYQSSLDPMRGCTNQRYYIKAPDGELLIPPGNVMPKENVDGAMVIPKTAEDKVWRWSQERYLQEVNKGNIVFKKSDGVLINSEGKPAKWNVYTKIWLSDREEEGMVPVDLINKWENRQSTKELTELGIPFDFAKPVDLLKYLMQIVDENRESIILDFFSGSATTAHAVMQLNAEDSGHRKFIMVQLPEKCDENSEAAKAGYKTICEIGKERIRRAGDKILAEQQAKEKSAADKTDLFDSTSDKPAAAKPLDIGFRVLKIDDSNMKDVYYSAGEISQQDLVEQISNIKDGRTDMDLLFGCLVDWGVPLSLPIKTETIENLQVYNVNDGDLVACFADDIPEAAIRQIAAAKPLRAVFRDSSFKSDSAKINVTEIFKTISPNTTVKVV